MTRREALGCFLAGPLAAFTKKPSTVTFRVPNHACDCHTHIFGDPAKFPFSPTRTYTPEPALPAEMAGLHRALGIERVVIVTPSVYGSDNAATVYGVQARGDTARGIAVVDQNTSTSELDALDKAGFRGIRLNLVSAGVNRPALARARFEEAIALVKPRGWHIQIYTTPDVIRSLEDVLGDSPVPVVFDHFGGSQAARGTSQPGFGSLLALLRSGRVYVKISGAYRASTNPPAFSDVAPLAKALISANADRIVWGTDWPHPDSSLAPGAKPADIVPPLPIDDGALLNQLALWAPDAATRAKILVDNPAALYGFSSADQRADAQRAYPPAASNSLRSSHMARTRA
jgi:predicted TIM-barrel fold metal-dependent hydrolase